MKTLVSIYCEGNDLKLAVLSKSSSMVTIQKVVTIAMVNTMSTLSQSFKASNLDDFDDISMDNLGANTIDSGNTDTVELASELRGFNLKNAEFIPVLTEPSLNYHIFEGFTEKNPAKLIQAIIKELQETKGISVTPDNVGYYENADGKLISAFIEEASVAVGQVNSLATFNNRRYYKIPTLKSAELSLYNYVSRSQKFYPEDYSLVIYAGKDSSKLLFLEGYKLKHIGTSLDIGTQNLLTYDVYFSKILLEMENGGVPKLDNVILCGEDNSENLILSFYGTFPEANVTQLPFDVVNQTFLSEEDKSNISSYAIPIAAALEYYDELDKKYKGFNLLPNYIKENQKLLQFGWHSYVILPILFFVAFYFTLSILESTGEIAKQNTEIQRLKLLQATNQAILDEMTQYELRINNFDATQAILDSAATGSAIWAHSFEKTSKFLGEKRNFWISGLSTLESNKMELNGYALSRQAVTEFTENMNGLLRNMLFEPQREVRAYAFSIKLDIDQKKDKK